MVMPIIPYQPLQQYQQNQQQKQVYPLSPPSSYYDPSMDIFCAKPVNILASTKKQQQQEQELQQDYNLLKDILPSLQLFIDKNLSNITDYVRIINTCRRMTHLLYNDHRHLIKYKELHNSTKVLIESLRIKDNISYYSLIGEQNPNGILLFSLFFKESTTHLNKRISRKMKLFSTSPTIFPAEDTTSALSDQFHFLDLASPPESKSKNTTIDNNDAYAVDCFSSQYLMSTHQDRTLESPSFLQLTPKKEQIVHPQEIGRNSTPVRMFWQKEKNPNLAPINKQSQPVKTFFSSPFFSANSTTTTNNNKITTIPFPPFSSPTIRMPSTPIIHDSNNNNEQRQQHSENLRSSRIKRKKDVDKFTFSLDIFDSDCNSDVCFSDDNCDDNDYRKSDAEKEQTTPTDPPSSLDSSLSAVNTCIYNGSEGTTIFGGGTDVSSSNDSKQTISMLTEMISSQGIGSSFNDFDFYDDCADVDGSKTSSFNQQRLCQQSIVFSNSYIDNLNIRDFNPSYGSPSMMSVSPPQRPNAPITATFRSVEPVQRGSRFSIAIADSPLDTPSTEVISTSLDERRREYFAAIGSNKLYGTQSDTLSIW